MGAGISILLGVYGRVHDPAGQQTISGFFGSTLAFKSWMASLVLFLPFLATLPVAYHCLWAIGFEPDMSQPRRFIHSLLGCFFYGAFVVKVVAVRSRRLPGWMLPAIGGTVFTSLVGLWLTSSLWFFTNIGFPGF